MDDCIYSKVSTYTFIFSYPEILPVVIRLKVFVSPGAASLTAPVAVPIILPAVKI